MADKRYASGTFCWTELMTRDVGAAKEFYGELLGWKFRDDMMTGGRPYTMISPPDGKETVGGMMVMDGPQFEGIPSHWLAYIAVDDIDAKAQRCGELGGQVHVPPMDIPNIGRFCVIQDPTGAVVALFQGR